MEKLPFSPLMLLDAYASGIFPMAEARDSAELHWIDPTLRGIFPLQGFHISRSLRREMLRTAWQTTVDTDFAGVVDGCAAREETWINGTIRAMYLALHERGHAHSIEIREGDALIGGVYGVTIGGAFFGESMFSARTNASKMALACLIDRLRSGGFTLFDTQFLTQHLASLGAIEIPRGEYRKRLRHALRISADFFPRDAAATPAEVARRWVNLPRDG